MSADCLSFIVHLLGISGAPQAHTCSHTAGNARVLIRERRRMRTCGMRMAACSGAARRSPSAGRCRVHSARPKPLLTRATASSACSTSAAAARPALGPHPAYGDSPKPDLGLDTCCCWDEDHLHFISVLAVAALPGGGMTLSLQYLLCDCHTWNQASLVLAVPALTAARGSCVAIWASSERRVTAPTARSPYLKPILTSLRFKPYLRPCL